MLFWFLGGDGGSLYTLPRKTVDTPYHRSRFLVVPDNAYDDVRHSFLIWTPNWRVGAKQSI